MPYVLTRGMATAIAGSMPSVLRRSTRKVAKKCSLPGCENLTEHRGGYCCAEHCKEHALRQREAARKEA